MAIKKLQNLLIVWGLSSLICWFERFNNKNVTIEIIMLLSTDK